MAQGSSTRCLLLPGAPRDGFSRGGAWLGTALPRTNLAPGHVSLVIFTKLGSEISPA